MRRTALILSVALLAGLLGACSNGDASLPKVSGQFGAKPKITIPKDAKPSKDLQYDVLKEGSGAEVGKGDLLVADYVGEVYQSGKVFDSSYRRGIPAAFPIGAHEVINGWDKIFPCPPLAGKFVFDLGCHLHNDVERLAYSVNCLYIERKLN